MKKKISFILVIVAAAVGLWFWGYDNHKNTDNIPSKSIAVQMDAEKMERILYGFQIEQLIEVWGEPEYLKENAALWKLDENTSIKVFFTPQDIIQSCSFSRNLFAKDENPIEYGTRMIESYTDRMEDGADYRESGYQLEVLAEKIPADALEDSLEEATESIREQYENYELYSSILPGHWTKKFESRDEAYDYLNYEPVKCFSWDLQEAGAALSVSGNESGDVFSVHLETSYVEEDIRLQFSTNLYTDKYEHEMIFGNVTTERVEFAEDFYATESNKNCHIIESSALESGYYMMDGYLVDDGILYRLHISYLEKDAARAKELMHLWAELF